jgi:hypothetical protein
MGLTPRRVVIVLYSVAAGFGALSLLTMTSRGQVVGLVVIASSVMTWVGIQQLGYAEFAEIQRTFRHGLGNERKALGNNVFLASLADSFRGAPDLSRLWTILTEVAARLQFARVELQLPVHGGAKEAVGKFVWEDSQDRPDAAVAVWTMPLGTAVNTCPILVLTRSLWRPAQFESAYLLNAVTTGFGPRLRTLLDELATKPSPAPRLIERPYPSP